MTVKKASSYFLVALVAAFVAIQFAPIEKTNPRITREIQWDSPETEALARRACYDCHSNETRWPWYASVAPVSWRVTGHVTHARDHLNFSAWDQPNEDLDEIVDEVEKGEMPLSDYLLLHWDAKLSVDEQARLLDGMRATFAQDPPIARERPGRPSETDDTPADSVMAGPDSTAVSPAVEDESMPPDTTQSVPGDTTGVAREAASGS